MAALELDAAFFTAVRIGYKPKLQILAFHDLDAAQLIFGIPAFRASLRLTASEPFSANVDEEYET